MWVTRTAYADFVKIRPMGAEWFHQERQADSHDVSLFAIGKRAEK